MDLQELGRLAERAKELECVYAVDEVLQDSGLTLSEAMTKLVHIIPTGFTKPESTHVRIKLWADCYEAPGFAEAQQLYSTPVLLEGKPVGEVAVGCAPTAREEGRQILQQEIRMVSTIAHRISQMALGRQRDLTLLLNILLQIDLDMLLRIGEKLQVYLEQTADADVRELFADFHSHADTLQGETNVPLAAGHAFNAEAYAQQLVAGAAVFLSQDTIIQLINRWLQEERILAFVKTLDSRESSISSILNAVRKYTGSVQNGAEAGGSYSQTETWLISELTHRFLSDDEHLINLVLDNFHIPDFEPMIEHIIGSERSTGNIGGKGAGLFIASQILRHAAQSDPLLRDIKIPRTWYLATDQIVDFLHYNDMEDLNSYKYNSTIYLRTTYDKLVNKIKNAVLPPQTVKMLRVVLDDLAEVPLIVRSSSLLEDKFNGTFSGKYKSLFLANQGTRQERLAALTDAVLEVYSSMYNPDSIQYRKERGLLNFTEQMGVLIQEVVGTRVGPYYLPLFAGVAFSDNLLRWSPRIRREDSLVRLVMGLGTRAVDRVNNDYPIMFAPGQPQLLINQSPSDVRHYSPKQIDLIDLESGCFTTVEVGAFLREMGDKIPNLHQLVSVYAGDMIEEKNRFSLNPAKDEMVITFHQVLTSGNIPKQLKRMLDVLSEKIEVPVDIEFACDGEHLYLLQCRPQGTGPQNSPAPIPQNLPRQDVLFTANRFVSDGLLENIAYIVYVDGDAYHALSSREQLLAVGEAVGKINESLPRRKYILMGPGRWGSRGDIQLGVRVTYSDISGAAALIEIAKEKHSYIPELSFGTHFFQDLVESNILYIPIYPDQEGIIFKESFFLGSKNILGELLPQYAWLSDVVHVIDVPAVNMGRVLSVHMNAQLEEVVAFFTQPQEAAEPKKRTEPRATNDRWNLESRLGHWEWRRYMAQQLSASVDMQAFGVKGIYLYGSADTGEAGIGSDIDMIFHVDGDDAQLARLRLWLDGWSRALARINFLQTGHDAEQLLDFHLVTDEDIAAGNSYALKISSSRDPATLLRDRSCTIANK